MGVSLNITGLFGDPYINGVISGAVEVTAILLAAASLQRVGRKPAMMTLLGIIAAAGFIPVPLQVLDGMSMIARFMGPTWGPSGQDPGGPHVGPMNFAIWGSKTSLVGLIIRSIWRGKNCTSVSVRVQFFRRKIERINRPTKHVYFNHVCFLYEQHHREKVLMNKKFEAQTHPEILPEIYVTMFWRHVL